MRDVMIGATPPAAINDWRYVAISVLGGMIKFFWYRIIERLSSPVLIFDAAGLPIRSVGSVPCPILRKRHIDGRGISFAESIS